MSMRILCGLAVEDWQVYLRNSKKANGLCYAVLRILFLELFVKSISEIDKGSTSIQRASTFQSRPAKRYDILQIHHGILALEAFEEVIIEFEKNRLSLRFA